AVIREVRLTPDKQAGDGALEVVVHPEPTHRVMDCGVDAHRHLVRVVARDPLVHLEQVAVALLNDIAPEALDRLGEVEVDAVLLRPNAMPRVHLALSRTRRDVAR